MLSSIHRTLLSVAACTGFYQPETNSGVSDSSGLLLIWAEGMKG